MITHFALTTPSSIGGIISAVLRTISIQDMTVLPELPVTNILPFCRTTKNPVCVSKQYCLPSSGTTSRTETLSHLSITLPFGLPTCAM